MNILTTLLRLIELTLSIPLRVVRFLMDWVLFNPRLGPLRHVAMFACIYVVFAFTLVYAVAPLRGMVGQSYLADSLHYDAERWLATAIYDVKGDFAGTFDPRLDSRRDVNFTSTPIEFDGHIANPDHKSIPVREVPDYYWRCLVYHEDRHIGTTLNPYGIDLLGVLKIPYSTVKRSLRRRRLSFGVGGSTLPMQFARVIYKTPPHLNESAADKLKRKFSEWWLAPVIYRELTKDGDDKPLRQWAANHIWLAQRTGGQPLHGVEVTSRIVFGKQAKDLTIAEQFVLASAVNKPIILLEGSDRLNAVRLDRWRYITEVRANACAQNLIDNEKVQREVVFDLVNLAGGPPDPHVQPRLQEALNTNAPRVAERAKANPIIRANALMPAARFGIREEMKQTYGFGWRDYVRGVTTTFDAAENLTFTGKIRKKLARVDRKYSARLDTGIRLDPSISPSELDPTRRQPSVVVVAANAEGEIVRYYESGETAPYFGAPVARSSKTGKYNAKGDPRMIASTGKVIAAVGIANQRRDTAKTRYLDTNAPAKGLETCRRTGRLRRGRTAEVAFACSLNSPLLNRTAQVGQRQMKSLIDKFGFNMPPTDGDGDGTPPSTAAVLGQISGSPRKVHQMAAVVLGALTGHRTRPVKLPSLVRTYDYTGKNKADAVAAPIIQAGDIIPASVIAGRSHGLLKHLLQAPLCYRANGRSHGTLKSLSKWCASRRNDLRLHFAKTGTQVNEDPDATVDAWITGGLQFANGATYSYVVLVGTGAAREPWARKLHSSQVAAPLLESLLEDLKAHAQENPRKDLLPKPKPRPNLQPMAQRGRPSNTVARNDAFKKPRRKQAKREMSLAERALHMFSQ
ncbi:MAG: transglycosylase domain-containing protein [Hyphomicrobiaceae bacterium]